MAVTVALARGVIVLGQRLVQLQLTMAVVVIVGVGLNDLDQQTAGELQELQGFVIHLLQGLHRRLQALRTAMLPLLLSPVPAQTALLGLQVHLDLQLQLQVHLIAAALLPLIVSAQSASNHCSKIRVPSCAQSTLDLDDSQATLPGIIEDLFAAAPRDFMKAKDVIEKDVDTVLGKTAMKSFVGKSLHADCRKLDEEQQAAVRKQGGDTDKILKALDSKVEALKQLKLELPDVEKSSLADWQARLTQAKSELEAAMSAAATHRDTVKHVLSKASSEKRKVQQAQRYQRVKLATTLQKNGCSDHLATVISELVDNEQLNPLPPTPVDCLDWTGIMYFDKSNEQGLRILGSINKYAETCVNIEQKTKSLKAFLQRETAKVGRLVSIPMLAANTSQYTPFNLSEALGLKNPLICEDEKGNTAWITAGDSWHLRRGADQVPLPGVSCLVRLVSEISLPVTLLIINLKPVVEAGLTVLSDLVQFAGTESGSKVIKDCSLTCTLASHDCAVYVPMGFFIM